MILPPYCSSLHCKETAVSAPLPRDVANTIKAWESLDEMFWVLLFLAYSHANVAN
jgi:hypothetical protein